MTAAGALRRLDAWYALIRIGFLVPLAFRLFPFMMILSYPIIMTGYYFLYRAIWGAQGSVPIGGLTGDEAITYMMVGWTVRSLYKNPVSRLIGDRVKSGEVAIDLIKPIGFASYWLMQGLGRTVHRMAFISLPLAVLVLWTDMVQLPQHSATYGWFALSVALGFLIGYAIAYVTGLLAFFFEYNYGLDWMMDLMVKLLGGLLIPLTFFPDWFAKVLNYLPFSGMFFQPAYIFLEKITGPALYTILAQQVAWTLILFAIGHVFLRLGHKKLLLQGG